MQGPSATASHTATDGSIVDASAEVADKVALLEAELAVLDQVRDWIRRSMLVVFALWVFTSIARELYFHEAHRLPLAIMLVLLGAAVLGIVLRAVLGLCRSRHARQLQAIRSEILIHESRNPTTKP